MNIYCVISPRLCRPSHKTLFFSSERRSNYNGSPLSMPSGPFFHTKTANSVPMLLIGFIIVVSFQCGIVNLHSCKDFKTAWKEEEQVPRDLFNNACARASSLFEHRQAYQQGWTGLFFLSVPGSAPVRLHRVNLSPFRQKRSENRSSCICEVWRNLRKKAMRAQKPP